jgi:hypothetical protein
MLFALHPSGAVVNPDTTLLDDVVDEAVFAEIGWYRHLQQVRRVKLRDAKATARWLEKRARTGEGVFFGT